MKKIRNKQRWIVYCLKSKEKIDWTYIYKVWCCKVWNLQNRIYYWNCKLKTKFRLKNTMKSRDIFKNEGIVLWELHGLNLWININSHFELFWDFDNIIEEKINILFSKIK